MTSSSHLKPDARYFLLIGVIFAVAHGLLFVNDVTNDEAFLTGDRALSRIEKIRYLFHGANQGPPFHFLIVSPDGPRSFLARLVEIGNPGDYVFHGLLYHVGGEAAVIAVQVLLSFVAVLCVYHLAILLGRSRSMACVAAVAYGLLPGSLMLPHQLASEGLYNPLVVIGLYLIVRTVTREFRYGAFLLGLAALGMAILVRLQLAFYPIVLALVVGICCGRRWFGRAALVVVVCLLPIVAWTAFVYGQTGGLRIGSADAGLGPSLFKTVERVSAIDGFAFDASPYPDRKMPLAAFIGEAGKHPLAYLKTEASDFVNLVFNPGINWFAGHYLGLLETEQTLYWKKVRDRQGISGVIRHIVASDPVFAVAFFSAAVLWWAFLLCSAIGLVSLLRDGNSPSAAKTILLSYLVYGWLVVHVASAVRWSHRTPIEFVIALLFATGLEWIIRWRASAAPAHARGR